MMPIDEHCSNILGPSQRFKDGCEPTARGAQIYVEIWLVRFAFKLHEVSGFCILSEQLKSFKTSATH